MIDTKKTPPRMLRGGAHLLLPGLSDLRLLDKIL